MNLIIKFLKKLIEILENGKEENTENESVDIILPPPDDRLNFDMWNN